MARYNEEHLGKKLESVGAWIQITNGMVYPLLANGGTQVTMNGMVYPLPFDINDTMSCHVRDIEPDGDWMTSLSDDDRKIVEAVLASQQKGGER